MRETASIFGLAHYLVAGIELVEGPLSLSGILTKPYVALQLRGLCRVSLAQCTKSKKIHTHEQLHKITLASTRNNEQLFLQG